LKTIEELLEEVGEDKSQNFSTTSLKFKTDLWNYFKAIPESKKWKCVEFGTHKGQTTRILSFLFDRVHTINLPNHFDEAKRLNMDRENIKYEPLNLYESEVTENFKTHPISVFFIDAGHTTQNVLSDVARAKTMKLSDGEIYFVFDDYGLLDEVNYAINQLIFIGEIEKVQTFGHVQGHSFGGFPERVLRKGDEGLICKLIR